MFLYKGLNNICLPKFLTKTTSMMKKTTTMKILNVHLARMWVNSIHIKSSDFREEVLFSNRGYLATVWKEFGKTEITFSFLLSIELLTELYKSIETSDLCELSDWKMSSLQSLALSD